MWSCRPWPKSVAASRSIKSAESEAHVGSPLGPNADLDVFRSQYRPRVNGAPGWPAADPREGDENEAFASTVRGRADRDFAPRHGRPKFCCVAPSPALGRLLSPLLLWWRQGRFLEQPPKERRERLIAAYRDAGRCPAHGAAGPVLFFPSRASMPSQAAGERDNLRRQWGALSWPVWIASRYADADGTTAMHLHIYRDESRSGHFDLVGGGDHPWTIDLVAVTAAAILLVGFAGAVALELVR
jgi:hypothetical protein